MKTRTAALIVCAIVAILAVTACGGGSHKTTNHHRKTKKKRTDVVATLAETVRGITGSFASHLQLPPGAFVVFRTVLPGTPTSPPMKVRLHLTTGPGNRLTVTARAHGQKSTAVVTGPTGKPISLVGVKYTCWLPPAQTFCPARHLAASGHTAEVTFMSSPAQQIVLAGQIGPVHSKHPVPTGTATDAVVPPYGIHERVQVIPPKGSKAAIAKPSSTVKVKPGDIVVLLSSLVGHVIGAEQKVTIKFNQGPASSTVVSATVAGGATSTATIAGAKGSSFAIVLPHYSCPLPPTPSFCPATRAQVQTHHYTVTFKATPLSPIDLFATVQAG